MATLFKRYESIGAVLDAARANPFFYHEQAEGRYAARTDSDSKGWCGGAYTLEACDLVEKGKAISDGVLDNAHKLMDKIDASFRDRQCMQWTPSVAGAYPIVPEYLLGMPENMRHRSDEEDDRAPLRIYVEVSYSSGVSQEAIAQRGTALAALAMRLSEERPVEFCAFGAWRPRSTGNNTVWVAPIATAPMGLVEVLNVIASAMFARPINFNVTNDVQFRATGNNIGVIEGFPFMYTGDSEERRVEKFRKYFNMEPNDIVITRGYLPDEAKMRNDPVEWVHRQLEKQRSVND